MALGSANSPKSSPNVLLERLDFVSPVPGQPTKLTPRLPDISWRKSKWGQQSVGNDKGLDRLREEEDLKRVQLSKTADLEVPLDTRLQWTEDRAINIQEICHLRRQIEQLQTTLEFRVKEALELKAQRNALLDAHRDELCAETARGAKEIANCIAQHQKESSQMKQSYESQLADRAANHQEELSRIVRLKEQDVAEAEKRTLQQAEAHANEVAGMVSKMSAAQIQHESDIVVLKSTSEKQQVALKAELEGRLAQLAGDHQQQLIDAHADFAKKTAASTSEYERQLAEAHMRTTKIMQDRKQRQFRCGVAAALQMDNASLLQSFLAWRNALAEAKSTAQKQKEVNEAFQQRDSALASAEEQSKSERARADAQICQIKAQLLEVQMRAQRQAYGAAGALMGHALQWALGIWVAYHDDLKTESAKAKAERQAAQTAKAIRLQRRVV
eukprot:gnl/MRDRNA2_/MRDRNA2_18950_c0_seq2.p1 gnl/MRDRNA2_/MRDRNA2_18950_c0~~gnl/MRDRNA2_/MRDRNA2_18950_c0_seq2.p1  ORF type:complete len:455 (-),score=120.19 gnl/MRDRNA2_/MRDRNA2_18950_c0_seq2:697-2025(-)